MNSDVIIGRLKQVRGQTKVWWGNLTHNKLHKVSGHFDILFGLLQENFGYTRGQADEGYRKRLK